MQTIRVNRYDMAYLDVGQGQPLICVHGSLCDFRVWSCVLGPLSQRHRVIAVSLRRCFPEHWDGLGNDYNMPQHIADVIAFIEALGAGPVDLMGHSRGGHLAFRVAQQRPHLLRRLILAEPGGDLDPSLGQDDAPLGAHVSPAAEKIAAGDVDGGLAAFIEAIEGPGAWRLLPAAAKQELRDNAHTLLGQVNDQRRRYTRADAEAILLPTLFIGGENTRGKLPLILRALASHVPNARTVIIPKATHVMFEQDAVRFCAAVLDFLS